MTDSSLEAAVTQALRDHQPKPIADRTSRPGFVIWHDGCTACDWTGRLPHESDAFTNHVSAAVIEALKPGADDLTGPTRAMCRELYGDGFDLHDHGAQDPEGRADLERAAEAAILAWVAVDGSPQP